MQVIWSLGSCGHLSRFLTQYEVQSVPEVSETCVPSLNDWSDAGDCQRRPFAWLEASGSDVFLSWWTRKCAPVFWPAYPSMTWQLPWERLGSMSQTRQVSHRVPVRHLNHADQLALHSRTRLESGACRRNNFFVFGDWTGSEKKKFFNLNSSKSQSMHKNSSNASKIICECKWFSCILRTKIRYSLGMIVVRVSIVIISTFVMCIVAKFFLLFFWDWFCSQADGKKFLKRKKNKQRNIEMKMEMQKERKTNQQRNFDINQVKKWQHLDALITRKMWPAIHHKATETKTSRRHFGGFQSWSL